MNIPKPSYTTTKQSLWISLGFAWAIMLALTIGALLDVAGAVALANIAFPIMAALIAAMLGIHRAFGSIDMRSVARAPQNRMPSEPSHYPRDQPAGDDGEVR